MPVKTISTGRALMGGGTYADKVMGHGPIAYWPLWEQSGTTAICLPNSAMNGTYARNVTVMGTGAGIGDGYTAPVFTPGADRVNIFSAALQAAFNGDEGTLLAWGIVANVGVWTDGQSRRLVHGPHTDFSNFIYLGKDAVVNRFQNSRAANAVAIVQQFNGLVTVNWFCTALTWSTTANQLVSYFTGQAPVINAGLNNWVGATLNANVNNIGAQNNTFVSPWDGRIAHVALWTRALSSGAISDLMVVS